MISRWRLALVVALIGLLTVLIGRNAKYLLYEYDRFKTGSTVTVGSSCYRLPSGWVLLQDTAAPAPVQLRHALVESPDFATVRDGSSWTQLQQKLVLEQRVSASLSVFVYREPTGTNDPADRVVYDGFRGLMFTGTNTSLLVSLAQSLQGC